MRPPLTYWGGKQNLLKHILPMIPEHKCYIEPFCGGAAVFFAKLPAKISIINDKNGEVVNFYEVLRSPRLRRRLCTELQQTSYARKLFLRAIDIFFSPRGYSRVERAWALFTACAQAYNTKLSGSWSLSATANRADRWQRKIELLCNPELEELLKHLQLDNRDALVLIRAAKPDSFIYADPPYPDADQGHYSGYSYTDLELLLKELEQTPAKFMLSSYPSELLRIYVERNGWQMREIICPLNASPRRENGHRVKKTEVLTMNYTLNQ